MDITKFQNQSRKTCFDEKERAFIRRRYNIGALIKHLAGDKSADAGFEREVADEMRFRADVNINHGGVAVPYCALMPDVGARTLTGKTNVDGHITGNGAAIVATDLLADEYINPLASKLVLRAAGARFIDGLVGDVAIPKGGDVSAYWLTAEDAAATQVSPTFTQLTGTPHTVAARVDVSRKLAAQAALPVRALIGELLTNAVSREIDSAALSGNGESGKPTGLISTSGISSVSDITADAPTYADLLRFVAALDADNIDLDALKWVAPAAVRAVLASTLDSNLVKNVEGTENVGAVTSAKYLCEKNVCADYPLLTSNLAPAKKLILGDWQQLCVLGWGEGVEILLDRYSLSTSGALRIVVFKDVDVLVRYPEAFAVGTILS